VRRWVVLREGERRRSGGDLRRRYLLDGLIDRTGAVPLDDRRPGIIKATLRGVRPRWHVWRRHPAVASTELLTDEQLAPVLDLAIAGVVDVHDEPVLHAQTLGLPMPTDEAAAVRGRLQRNLQLFRLAIAQSASFVRLAGMDPTRTIVAPNGCDPSHILPTPMTDDAVIGYVSGAAPGRGIEALIAAARQVRESEPTLILRLWLTATGEASAAYLEGLPGVTGAEDWIQISTVAYAELSAALASATVLCVPNPVNRYWDTVLPIKLFDSMAARRPVVVTPCEEMTRVVTETEAGLVARGDRPEDLAEVLLRLLRDRPLAERLAANGRRAAEEQYAWSVIGARLADQILERIR
jgi:glycosyltransferase involved in cell wall biosynthesis